VQEAWIDAGYESHTRSPTNAVQLFAWYGLERFIQADDDLEYENNQGWTAIFFASAADKATTIVALVHNGADIHLVDKDSRSALSHAAAAGNSQSIQILLYKGANVNLVDKTGQFALLYAAGSWYGSEAVQILVDKGANLNLVDKNGQSALSYAAARGKSNLSKSWWPKVLI
jgi:uncharacterized protein